MRLWVRFGAVQISPPDFQGSSWTHLTARRVCRSAKRRALSPANPIPGPRLVKKKR